MKLLVDKRRKVSSLKVRRQYGTSGVSTRAVLRSHYFARMRSSTVLHCPRVARITVVLATARSPTNPTRVHERLCIQVPDRV